MLFAITHFCVFNPIATTHHTCVFSSFVDDTHIVGPTSNVILVFFMIISKICYIKTFHLTSKVSSLYPIGIKLVHIIFFRFFNTRHRFWYSRCTNGFYAICEVLCCKGTLKGLQHHNEPPYAYKSIGSRCDAFILLCVMPMLFITYCIFISVPLTKSF